MIRFRCWKLNLLSPRNLMKKADILHILLNFFDTLEWDSLTVCVRLIRGNGSVWITRLGYFTCRWKNDKPYQKKKVFSSNVNAKIPFTPTVGILSGDICEYWGWSAIIYLWFIDINLKSKGYSTRQIQTSVYSVIDKEHNLINYIFTLKYIMYFAESYFK